LVRARRGRGKESEEFAWRVATGPWKPDPGNRNMVISHLGETGEYRLSEPWKPVPGNRTLETGPWKPVPGNRSLATGPWKPVPGNRFLETGSWKPVPENRFLETGSWKPVPGNRFLETGPWKPVPGNRFLETRTRTLGTETKEKGSQKPEIILFWPEPSPEVQISPSTGGADPLGN
jgi:hypothetical protein